MTLEIALVLVLPISFILFSLGLIGGWILRDCMMNYREVPRPHPEMLDENGNLVDLPSDWDFAVVVEDKIKIHNTQRIFLLKIKRKFTLNFRVNFYIILTLIYVWISIDMC